MCLKSHELVLLEDLRSFLRTFSAMTDLVSSNITSLSLIPLVRAEISDACKPCTKDCDELKSLKRLILANIDKRLPLTDSVTLATLLDPTTKSLVNMTDSEKEDLLYNAVIDSEPTDQRTNVDDDEEVSAVTPVNRAMAISSSQSSAPLSKKLKLVQKHAPVLEQRDRGIREEIRSYLRCVPGDADDDPLVFWRQDHYSSLRPAAKKHLTRSAASVPVENLFSVTGILLNGKRSSLAPHRANWLTFIHDNYEHYFDVNF